MNPLSEATLPRLCEDCCVQRERFTRAFSRPGERSHRRLPPPLDCLPAHERLYSPRRLRFFPTRQDGFPRNLAQAAWLESVRDVTTGVKLPSSWCNILVSIGDTSTTDTIRSWVLASDSEHSVVHIGKHLFPNCGTPAEKAHGIFQQWAVCAGLPRRVRNICGHM